MESHKEAALSFLQMVVDGDISEAYGKYVSPDMRHHNMAFPGDAASLEKAMRENHVQFPNKIFEVKQVLAEDERVAVFSHLRLREDDPGFAVAHILRFEDDRIVEMWDMSQPVSADSPNENGMF